MAQIEVPLVLDSVSSPITRRVYNLGLDEFVAWYMQEPRPAGFTKATVTADLCSTSRGSSRFSTGTASASRR
jgi:hypothetical protein